MNYENRVVLFLDILGFRSIIEETTAGDKDRTLAIKKLHDNLKGIGSFMRDKLKGEHLSTQVTQFSDSIIVSFLDEDFKLVIRLIKTIQELIINLANDRLLCRGAISYGKLVHSNRIVFGPALNDAYETETKAALYPRVILDRTIIDLGKKDKSMQISLFGNAKDSEERILSYLRRDTDDKYYIDYFPENITDFSPTLDIQSYLENLRAIIVKGSKSSKPDLKVKYGWMKNKYNRLLRQLKNRDSTYKKGAQKYIDNLTPLK